MQYWKRKICLQRFISHFWGAQNFISNRKLLHNILIGKGSKGKGVEGSFSYLCYFSYFSFDKRMEIRKGVNLKCVCKAVTLENRFLAVLYPPPIYYFQTDTIKRGSNAVSMSITPLATPESGDRERNQRLQPCKAHFCIKKTDFSTKFKIQSQTLEKYHEQK